MNTLIKYIALSFAALALVSCKDDRVSLGTVQYRPSFLWSDSAVNPVNKTFTFDFSQDAQTDKSWAEFQFVDNDGKVIGKDVMQVFDEHGRQLKNNRFRVMSDVAEKQLTFTFSPDAAARKYQGCIKLVAHHNLDRLGSQQLNPGEKVDAMQWTLHYDKVMNPLAKGLMWVGIVLFVLLLIWFCIIRPDLYPHFPKFRKSIIVKQNDEIKCQFTFVFTGARKVVFSNHKVKQSFFNRLFTGRVKTYVNPIFKKELTFTPRRKGAFVLGSGYAPQPNPIPRNGVATITNETNKEKLTIILR